MDLLAFKSFYIKYYLLFNEYIQAVGLLQCKTHVINDLVNAVLRLDISMCILLSLCQETILVVFYKSLGCKNFLE
jgi:hypothetical protein